MKEQRQRGSILVMTIFLMMVMFMVASAFIVLLPVESRAAMRSEHLTQSGLALDAGVSEAIVWLGNQLAPPDGSASREPMEAGVYPSVSERTRTLGNDWKYTWELIADENTSPNGNFPIRGYTILVTSFYNDRPVRRAEAAVLQESLSGYERLYDGWPENLVMGVRTTSLPTGGKVHVNDILRLWIEEGTGFWDDDGPPVFTFGLTTSGRDQNSPDGFRYYEGNHGGTLSNDKIPYNSNGPIESRYARIAMGGRDQMRSGASEVALPVNTFNIEEAAWGFGLNVPSLDNGVHINEVSGKVQGIYIEGDVDDMQLGVGSTESINPNSPTAPSVNYGENSWVKVAMASDPNQSIASQKNYTVITLDDGPITLPEGARLNGAVVGPGGTTIPMGGTLKREPDGSFASYNSELNGVVFTKGSIDNLWGTNKGRRTVAVDGDAGSSTTPRVENKIRIGGRKLSNGQLSLAAGEKGLIQWGATDADNDGNLDPPTSADHTLGLMAHEVMVSSGLRRSSATTGWSASHTSSNPLYIYAVVLAGLPESSDGTYESSGTYAVEDYEDGGGGFVNTYGSKVMSDGGAWGTTSGHGLVRGNGFFDSRAARMPPPFFPSEPYFSVHSYVEIPIGQYGTY